LACQALRHFNFLQVEESRKSEAGEIKKQEKAYKDDFHKFAKAITKGTYGKPTVRPTFSCEEANKFYSDKYSTHTTVDPNELLWFPEVSLPTVPYDLSPYTPEDIYSALRNKTPDSAPGDDEILYGFLVKMPSTHRFLSTVFTGIRDTSMAPEIWGSSKIILLEKGED
jgi:hypothetical protein